MDVKQVHPAWPEHAHTHCPACDKGLTVDDGSDYYDLVGKQEPVLTWAGPCPHCGEAITVEQRTVVRFKAQRAVGSAGERL